MNILNIYIVFLISGAFAAPAPISARTAVVSSTAAARGADSGPGAPLARAASKALDARNYQEASKLAAEALKADPGNREAATVLHFAAGRGMAKPVAFHPGESVAPTPAAITQDGRPATLEIMAPKGQVDVPDLPGSGEPMRYFAGGMKPPTLRRQFKDIWKLARARFYDPQSEEDRARLSALKAQLDQIETGRAVVASLGGWAGIEKKADLRMADLPDGTVGMSLKKIFPDKRGRTAILLISRTTRGMPDAVTVSIFAHELSHVSDLSAGGLPKGGLPSGLKIPSELVAHRLQVHAFLELAAKMTPAEKQAVAGNYNWEYMNFMTALWVDHILARFQKKEFVHRFSDGQIQQMAMRAYEDLDQGLVKAGSPHLDYHLTAPDNGMYTRRTNEKDILETVARDRLEGRPISANDQIGLKMRKDMMAKAERADDEYRRAHGYELGGPR